MIKCYMVMPMFGQGWNLTWWMYSVPSLVWGRFLWNVIYSVDTIPFICPRGRLFSIWQWCVMIVLLFGNEISILYFAKTLLALIWNKPVACMIESLWYRGKWIACDLFVICCVRENNSSEDEYSIHIRIWNKTNFKNKTCYGYHLLVFQVYTP